MPKMDMPITVTVQDSSRSVKLRLEERKEAARREAELLEPLFETVTVSKQTYHVVIIFVSVVFAAFVVMAVLFFLPSSATVMPTAKPTQQPTSQPTATFVDIDIAGAYTSNWGGSHEITSASWTESATSIIDITYFSNDLRFLVGKNRDSNTWNPGLWSRIDWHTAERAEWSSAYSDASAAMWGAVGNVAYCTSLYAAASEDAAMYLTETHNYYDTTRANSTGCGGQFAFSFLTKDV